MNQRLIGAVLLFFAAGVFVGIGVRGEPRNATYIVIGIVFLVLALARVRRYRTES
jgi:hypothetical protein